MPASRRALVAVPLAALALAAPSAQAAEVRTLPCVPYAAGQASMPILGTGFTPGATVRLGTTTAGSSSPTLLSSAQADATGAFARQVNPPLLASSTTHEQSFTLIALDTSNPAAPVQATFAFQVVRFGLTAVPQPRRPSQRVTYTARGFTPGRPVYMHFRFAGRTRRSVRLGVASSPCGIASRRMRALPTRARYGTWTTYTNQARRFSRSTRPAWRNTFTIFRRFR
jgi:hypothetical protein